MKKNKMMRAASALLVAVLLTTSVISGTFAKYVTSAEGTDFARVAKWGVEVTATGETFANVYAKTDNTFTLAANTVVSTVDVVAPGTNGQFAKIQISGTPEVATRVTYVADVKLENWKAYESDTDDTGVKYFPLVIKVNGTPVSYVEDAEATVIETAIENAIKAVTVDYEAGEDLSAATDVLNVTWEWVFNRGDAYDVLDTKLGNWELFGKQPPKITLTVEATVTQID